MFRPVLLMLLLLPLTACANRDARLCADGNADPDVAIAACTRLIALSGQGDASRAAWYDNRGMHAQRKGALDAAAADFDVAIRLDPKGGEHYLGRGVVHGTSGRLELALRDFDRAAELDPNSAPAHLNRAKVLSDTSRFPEALRAYDRALSLSGDYWYGYDGRCWVRAVIGQDLEGALSDCDRALDMQPGAGNPYNNRGLVYYRMKRYADSVVAYTASIAADPEVASSYYMRGLARRALGEQAAADADIAEGLRREPGVAERYAGYGIAYP